jgi:hypothetical protein
VRGTWLTAGRNPSAATLTMTNSTRITFLWLVLGVAVPGCTGTEGTSRLHLSQTAPSSVTQLPAPTITALTPATGSSGGESRTKITGNGFRAGATVTLGGATVLTRFDTRDKDGTTMYVDTPPHPAGTVAVVVKNPDGQSGTLEAGYTYLAPESLDFNGQWSGFGNAGQDFLIEFAITNNFVTRVSCDTHAELTFSPPLSVTNGQFSYARGDGVEVSGRIVSAAAAVGTLNLAPCTATKWSAGKRVGS